MSQFLTLDQAKLIAERVNVYPFIGGGVAPYTDDRNTSGIFLYTWAGPFPDPGAGDAKPYYLRFMNGNRENNAGLVADMMAAFPVQWPLMLASMTPPATYNWPV